MNSLKNHGAEKIRLYRYTAGLKGQKGITVVLVAVMLFLLIGFVALAIDVGYFMVTRNELQNIADASALAACRKLGSIYSDMTPQDQNQYTLTTDDEDLIKGEAFKVGLDNRAGGLQGISINENDIIIGTWDGSNFHPGDEPPDAVSVTVRRDDESANGPISTFFARALNINVMNVTSNEAIAALTGPSLVEEGELKTPFGLSENVFPNDCKDIISFSPTTDSCAGWHNFFDPINAAKMEDKLLGLIQGDADCEYCDNTLINGPEWLEANYNINKSPDPEETPSTSTGDKFEFQGGTISSLFLGGYLGSDYDGNTGTIYDNDKKPAPMIALFDYFRYRDGDNDDSVWTATIPVYKDSPDGCENPNKAIEILGFAKIVVYTSDPPPLSSLRVHVDCNFSVIEGRGGGGNYGNLKGTIPNLVK
jgi:hypothetical protein